MRIVIGCPVRNRAWVLPEYLTALEAIEYPDKVFCFLENDSIDQTLQMLIDFENSREDVKSFMMIPSGYEHWDHGDYSFDQYKHLADVRNHFIERFLEFDADYLLSIDSDVIVPPDIINRLLEYADENTIIGAAISNIPSVPLDGSAPGNFMVKKQGMIVHPNPYPLTGILDVDVIGAVYLIPRKVMEDGVRYAPHPQGEDISFCQQAQDKGYRLRVLIDVVCDHKMTRSDNHV